MFLEFKREVEDILRKALEGASYESEELLLEESEYADLSSRVSFLLSSIYKKSPKVIASDIVRNIEIPAGGLVSKAEAVGPYINFYVSDLFLEKTLGRIREEGGNYGNLHKKGRIIVEHTSANPDGPLHIGHLRNAIIGDCLVRILRKAGYDVEAHYYVNDMGRQVAIVVWGMDKIGGYDVNKKGDHAVAEVYVAANRLLENDTSGEGTKQVEEVMRRYEAGDEEVMRRYKEVVERCLSGIKATLEKIKIKHDHFVWESQFVRDGSVGEVIEGIKRRGRVKVEGSAVLLQIEGIDKELVLQRSDGTSLYTTRDIAYHKWKSERCDRMIDVFGKDHELVSRQLLKVLEMLHIKVPEFVIFEFVSLPSGSMSTRAGRYISADELIERMERRAYEEVARRRSDIGEDKKREIARKVGIGALRYDFVKVSPDKMMVFNFEEALDIEKKGAPFIQYAHARACSILRMAERRGLLGDVEEYDAALLRERSEVELIKKLSKLGYVVEVASSELKPYIVAKYGRELAESFNKFYKDCGVLTAEDELRKARLNLVMCAKTVLSITLDLLGIEAPEEM
ncbi:MAG: arginine--tRNA ligase [Candidatus Methanospirareceae archaeon]